MTMTKEQIIQRALDTTNFADHIHEDLSDLVTMITPPDVPMFSRLGRIAATALLHEWTEAELTTSFTAAKYADGNLPADHTNTHTRKDNKVMSIGRIAKATALLNATNTVGSKDAFARELEEKVQDLLRAVEYYIFNGDRAAAGAQEMDGLIKLVATANGSVQVANGNAVLSEANLKKVIVGCYNNGSRPDVIVARPEVAYQIASFTADKIRVGVGGAAGGVDAGTLRYLSPFGGSMEVIPVRADFLPSGNVLVLDSTKIKLGLLDGGVKMMDLPLEGDLAGRKLIKIYPTLEVRALKHHGKLTGVLDA